MANPYLLKNPKFSFVQFSPALDGEEDPSCCQNAYEFNLPVSRVNDLKFQLKIITESADSPCLILGNETPCELILLRGCGNDPSTIAANTLYNFTTTGALNFAVDVTGSNEATFYWFEPLSGLFDYINEKECFQLLFRFHIPGGSEVLNFFSPCFIRKSNPCNTSVMEYACEENSYDFKYCSFAEPPTNRIRLPLILLKSQITTTREVYIDSEGKWIVTNSISKKEYNALVDFVPELIHDKIAIALEHDIVNIEAANYNGAIRNNGSYTIDWIDGEDCLAQASFKANASPFDASNNNCQECDPPDENICGDTSPCDTNVKADWDIRWGYNEYSTDHPSAHITWGNDGGAYPAGGYLVTLGRLIGGVINWGTPKSVSFPDMFCDLDLPVAGYGHYYAKITAVCNNSTSHDTTLSFILGDTAPCDEDLDLSYTLVGGVAEVRWNTAPSWPAGGYKYQIGTAPGGIPSGAWGGLSAITYELAPGIAGFNWFPPAGSTGTWAVKVWSYCNAGTSHSTILIIDLG